MRKPRKDAQLKIDLDKGLKERVEALFQRQGVNMTEGVTRLLRTFADAGEDLHPLLLDQVRGASAKDLARAILRRLSREG
jgi:predicted component of type VI protein secretion system